MKAPVISGEVDGAAADALAINNRRLAYRLVPFSPSKSVWLERVIIGQNLASNVRWIVNIFESQLIVNKLLGPDIRTLLENHDLEPCSRELLSDDRACAAAADDNEVHGSFLVIFGQLGRGGHDCSSAS